MKPGLKLGGTAYHTKGITSNVILAFDPNRGKGRAQGIINIILYDMTVRSIVNLKPNRLKFLN